jgi:hypothetical protein
LAPLSFYVERERVPVSIELVGLAVGRITYLFFRKYSSWLIWNLVETNQLSVPVPISLAREIHGSDSSRVY